MVLVVATAMGPMSMQIFVPAVPVIQADFRANAAMAQLALSISFFSIAFATLAYGPLSDRFGRRPLTLAGLGLFIAGSVACLLANSIELLIAGRVVQACGGAAGLVLGRAMVRDLYDRDRSTVILAYLTMAVVVAPMLAPTIGGVITDLSGWRSVFLMLAIVGTLVLLASLWVITETHHNRNANQTAAGMLRDFGTLLRHPLFRGYALQTSFGMGMFFTFLGAAPFLMLQTLDMPRVDRAIGAGLESLGLANHGFRATLYGLYFILVSLGFMLGNFLAAKLSRKLGGERMIIVGCGLALVASVVGFAISSFHIWTPPVVFLSATVLAVGNGLAIPNGQSGLVSVMPTLAGSAAGLSGFLQMLTASIITQLVGTLPIDTPYPMYMLTLVCGGLSLAGGILAWRYQRRAIAPIG